MFSISTSGVKEADLLVVVVHHADGTASEVMISARPSDGLCVSVDASHTTDVAMSLDGDDLLSEDYERNQL